MVKKTLLIAGCLTLLTGCLFDNFKVDPRPAPKDENYGVDSVSLEDNTQIQRSFGTWHLVSAPGVGFTFSEINDAHAPLAITQARPKILLQAVEEQARRIYLVKLDFDDKDANRTLKIGSFSQAFSKEQAPDPSFIRPHKLTQDGPNRWVIQPLQDLVQGEYAIWTFRGLSRPDLPKGLHSYRSEVFHPLREYQAGIFWSFRVEAR